MDIVAIGPKGGEIKIALDDGSGLRKDFLDKSYVKSAVGPTAKKIIAQESAAIRESRKRIREDIAEHRKLEKIYIEKEKAEKEMQDLRTKIERTQATIDQLGSSDENESELQRLRQLKNKLTK